MKNMGKAAIASILAVCTLTGASAVQRLEAPRPLPTVRAYRTLPAGTVAPIGIGTPSNFAMGDTWIVSNLLPDEFSTDIVWYDSETLGIFAAFYSSTSKETATILQVKNQAGAIVAEGSFSDPAIAGAINYLVMGIGVLPAAPYKVILKFKQGTKVIGQQYWIGVFPTPVP